MSNGTNGEKSGSSAFFMIIGFLVAGMILCFIFVDEPLSLWLRHSPTKFNESIFGEAIEQLGKVYPIVWLLLCWVWITGKHKTVLIGLLALIITIPAVWSIKLAVQRPRPGCLINAEAKLEDRMKSSEKWSFPSGDTTSVFAVGTVLAFYARWPGIIGVVVCCSVVGILRVLNVVHYPSDVLAGAALGIFCGWAAIRIRNKTPKIENILGGREQILSLAGIFLIPLLIWLFQGPSKLNMLLTFYVPAALAISLAGLRQKLQGNTEQMRAAYIDQMRKQNKWFFKWKDFLPLMFIPFFLIELRHSTYPQNNHLLDRIWELFCFAVSLSGLGIRICTAGYEVQGTFQGTKDRQETKELNITGAYSIVRHPLYLGNLIIWAGIILLMRSVTLAAFSFLVFFLYYEKIIITEEAFLSEKFGKAFDEWSQKTPMLLPRFKLWRKPAQSFLWQAVFNREYLVFFAIIACFVAVEVLGDRFYEGKWKLDWLWAGIFCVGLLVFATLKTLRKLRIIGHS